MEELVEDSLSGSLIYEKWRLAWDVVSLESKLQRNLGVAPSFLWHFQCLRGLANDMQRCQFHSSVLGKTLYTYNKLYYESVKVYSSGVYS
jgi:hypothetical protein